MASFLSTNPDRNEFEFIVRMHRDDFETLREIPSLLFDYPNLRIIIGSNLDGFNSLGAFYEEIASIAKGKFVWLINDDEEVEGNWYYELTKAPMDALIKPAVYKLNKSTYHRSLDCGTVVMRNQCWKEFGATMPSSVDLAMYELLVVKHKWPMHFLEGVTGIHNRKIDRTLLAERY